MKRILFVLLPALCLSFAVHAQTTRYVSDELEITLRTGQSVQARILRMLESGTRLTVLETNQESGYSRVRTQNGTEGWILTRYLSAQPSARDRLAQAQERLATLETQNSQLEEQLDLLQQDKADFEAEREQLTQVSQRQERELDEIKRTAANALQLDQENEKLHTRLVQLERRMQTLSEENEALRDRTARDWFVVGALVVVGSMLLGILLTRIRWRRRSSWSSL